MQSLLAHFSRHLGILPHECPHIVEAKKNLRPGIPLYAVCEERFEESGALTKHRQAKHGYVPDRAAGGLTKNPALNVENLTRVVVDAPKYSVARRQRKEIAVARDIVLQDLIRCKNKSGKR